MEQELLQTLVIFFAGLVFGVLLMLVVNKLRSGSASPGKVKQEFNNYQAEVESHFEETSKKFKDMTEQYQDLYKHLSVGATTLCRADSVAAVGLANQSDVLQPAKLERPVTDKTKSQASSDKEAALSKTSAEQSTKAGGVASDKDHATAAGKSASAPKATPAGQADSVKTDSVKSAPKSAEPSTKSANANQKKNTDQATKKAQATQPNNAAQKAKKPS